MGYHYGLTYKRKPKKLIKVYGYITPARRARLDAEGWTPNQQHKLPHTGLDTSVKPGVAYPK